MHCVHSQTKQLRRRCQTLSSRRSFAQFSTVNFNEGKRTLSLDLTAKKTRINKNNRERDYLLVRSYRNTSADGHIGFEYSSFCHCISWKFTDHTPYFKMAAIKVFFFLLAN